MSNQLRSLDQITIPTPCDADWDSMTGNDQVRFCEHAIVSEASAGSATARINDAPTVLSSGPVIKSVSGESQGGNHG